MVVGCHQQPTIAAIFFDNGSHIIGNIPTNVILILEVTKKIKNPENKPNKLIKKKQLVSKE